jgi:hypothetical protein
MRWFRLLILGLASVYPLYWMGQFLLFFVPESLVGFWLGRPVQVLAISYLQAMAVVQPHAVFHAHWEALIFALFFAAVIIGVNGEQFVSGSLGIVVLGQAALLPFLSLVLGSKEISFSSIGGGAIAFGLIVLGLYQALRRTGGLDFFERLALLSLLAVLPQATLWLAFKIEYPFFDVRYLLLRLVPLYAAAIIAATLPTRLSEPVFSNVPWTEILASSAAAGLLLIAIGLTGRSLSARLSVGSCSDPIVQHDSGEFATRPSHVSCPKRL